MDRYKAQAREVLDRLREALLARFDEDPRPGLAEAAGLSGAVREYMDAEAHWHALPDLGDEED